MKNTLSLVLAALLVAGTATTAVLAESAPAALSGEDVNLVDAASKLLIGPEPLATGSLANIFDNDPETIGDFGVDGGDDYWVGIKLDQPTILTYVKLHGPGYNDEGVPHRPHVVYGAIVEGSNDGENWEFILQFGDDYLEYEEYAWDMEDGINNWADEYAWDLDNNEYADEDPTDPVAYTYYRIYNDTKGVAIYGDIQLYGYFVEAETEAPATEAPATEAPATEAPATEAPATEAPETEAPETEAPETEAPETEAPETEAPETEAPETEAPETEAPETEAPETEAPATEAPATEAPATEAPATEAPATEAPATEAPATEAPATEAPATEAPATEAPATEEPKVSDEFHFYGELVDTGIRATAPAGIENAVAGTIVGAGGTPENNTYAMAFDGNIDTFWAANENRWDNYMIALKADAPVAATSFVVATQGNGEGMPIRYHALIGSRIQGSTDGIEWTTLFTFGEWEYLEYSEEAAAGNYFYTVVPEDTTTEYTYFRYVNNDDGAAAIGEFVVIAAPATEAPATEAPATEAPATEAPATEAPATEAPATEAPATEAPATTAPTTGTDVPVAPQTFDLGVIAAAAAVVSAAGYAIAKKRK